MIVRGEHDLQTLNPPVSILHPLNRLLTASLTEDTDNRIYDVIGSLGGFFLHCDVERMT